MAGFELFEITNDEFKSISRLVRATAGITLNASKRALVVARLGKRLRHYGYDTFRQYCEHLETRDPDGSEALEMINCITTNKTEFFREPHHFDWLREALVPELRVRARATGVKKVRIWSAGCSTGQEPYSIAMVLADELGLGDWDVRILASDIDTKVLEEAKAGEYDEEDLTGIPSALLRKYFERRASRLSVTKAVRDLITFRRVNFIEPNWPIRAKFDVIFCRNVTIYFDRETQEVLYERFAKQLDSPGYLVAGHSENLHWLSRLFTPAGPTIYGAVGNAPRTSRRPGTKALSHRPGKALSLRPGKALSHRPGKALSLRPAAKAKESQKPPASKRSSRAPTKKQSLPPAIADVAIQSGELHASAVPAVVRTVLGSCVAACVYDVEAGVGGMNHFMLPDGCDTDWVPTRFGTHAMDKLLRELTKHGGDRARFRAKIFGGSHVLRSATASRAIPDDNVRFVRDYLAAKGIPIQSEKVGGQLPMMIRFETNTGRAFVRLIESSKIAEVAQVEARYLSKLNAVARNSVRSLKVAESLE